ncbi:MAG: hypothetical protein R3B36_09785 [Polyangiaceae bacterium]
MVNGRGPRRLLDGVLAVTPLRLILWITVIAAICPALFTNANQLHHFMDDHQFYNWEAADRISILRYKQLPFWNPYYCGGMVSAAAPESTVFSPDYILRLFVGIANGRRLAVVLFMMLGMEGVYRLSRECNGSAAASIAGALTFATYDKLLKVWLGMGWVNFFGFELVPWVVLGLVKGRTSVAWRLIGGLALGWIALSAGTYTAPYTGIALVAVTVCVLLRYVSPWDKAALKGTVASLVTVAGLGVVLGVAKLVPMAILMRQYPRVFTPVEINDKFQLLGQYWGVYWLVLVLAFVGLLYRDVWARVFVAVATLFFLLAMGQFHDWAPAALMKKLPLVSGLRLPDRFTVMFHLFVVLAATRGLTHAEDTVSGVLTRLWAWMRRSRARAFEAAVLPLAFTAVGSAVIYRYARPELEEILEHSRLPASTYYTVAAPREVDQPFKQHRGNRRDAHVFPPMNRGSLYCFVGIPLPESARLRADLAHEEYPEDPSAATVVRKAWSPHEIRLEVDATREARVFVNQNYNPHWTVDVGRVENVDALLAVTVPAGKHTVTLRYRDWTSFFCMTVSMLTFAGVAGWLTRRGILRARVTVNRWIALGVLGEKMKEEQGVDSVSEREDGSS